jgi:hypothetical protein
VTDAVLLLGFNRPGHLSALIDCVRRVEPSRVYAAIDGPRPDRAADIELVAETRRRLAEINWSCAIEVLERDSNLGCGAGVSTALDWFFAHEERGIILEDDLRPSPEFFTFASTMLDRYVDDPRVFAVSGSSYVPARILTSPALTYRFSRYPYVWGWATWRRSWEGYTLDASGWRQSLPWRTLVHRCGGSVRAAWHWARLLDDCASGRVDTWDAQLVLRALAAGQLTVVPNANLVDNEGFGADATHTRSTPGFLVPVSGQPLLPSTSVPVVPDERADAWVVRHQLGASPTRMAWREIRRVPPAKAPQSSRFFATE